MKINIKKIVPYTQRVTKGKMKDKVARKKRITKIKK